VRTLVLGGSRSGKSAFAEALLADAPVVEYVATAAPDPDDAEWADRIRRHQDRRPGSWTTVQTGDVAAALGREGPAVLVDSITTWLARAMDECGSWADEPTADLDERLDAVCAAWRRSPRRAVLVSDEVGLGVVPETRSGRLFRDVLGSLNQRLAAAADEVVLVVAGLPLRLR
jgi:adenosylcobinamide kinase/adenosylcobinamide-phosphate guanylyltransferase